MPGRDSATPAIDPEVKNLWRIAGFTGAVGIEVAVAIAIGALGGQWLDRKLGSGPWLTILGFAAGIGAAIKALVRVSRDYKQKIARDDARDGRQQNTTTTPPRDDDPQAP